MLARGFNGAVHHACDDPMKTRDFLFVLGALVLFAGVRMIG
jgi:energy-coupling factor transporter transmembrane protein EcfT